MKSAIASLSTQAASAALVGALATLPLEAQSQAALMDPNLAVAPVVAGLSQPISLAFIRPNDILVTQKASGQIKRVTKGVISGVVLDLPVEQRIRAYCALLQIERRNEHAQAPEVAAS